MRQIALILIDYLKCQVFRHTLIFWASKVASAFLDIRGISVAKSVSYSVWKRVLYPLRKILNRGYNFEPFWSDKNPF